MAQIKVNPRDHAARHQLASFFGHVAKALPDNVKFRPQITQLRRHALKLYQELVREFPDDSKYREQLGYAGRALAGSTDLEESLKSLALAVDAFEALATAKIDQKDGFYRSYHADSLNWLSWNLSRSGQAQEAAQVQQRSVDAYETLAREFPTNVRSYRFPVPLRALAERLVAAGQLEQAVEASRRYVAFCEKLQRENTQQELRPQLASAYLALCSSLTATNQVDEAQKVWHQAVAMGLSDTNALNQFAWNLVRARDVGPALAALAVEAAEQATKSAQNDPMILNTLGVAQYRADKWEEAIASLTKAEELAPDKTFAFNGFFLAMAQWQLGHKDEASKWYDRSVEWMEKNQPKNDELGRFRVEAEKVLGITQPDPAPKVAPEGDDPANAKR